MKKSILLLAALFTAMLTLKSQSLKSQSQSFPKPPNDVLFMDHVIRLHKAPSGYLYDIFYQNNLIIHQDKNPFDQTTNGLRTKEDAIKLAKWQVIHLYPLHRQKISGPQEIPNSVARQLKISSN
jgi:hypothetical protein